MAMTKVWVLTERESSHGHGMPREDKTIPIGASNDEDYVRHIRDVLSKQVPQKQYLVYCVDYLEV